MAVKLIPLTRTVLELTDFASVEKRFQDEQPRLIVHCAAMSKSPECQANPSVARKVNVEVTAQLAALANDVRFIFFSTDLVFDGRKGNYTESDAVNPLSVYGETKAAAEEIALRNPRHIVVRTSLNSGAAPTAHNQQLQALWQRGETAHLFNDEFRSPIPASVTARAIWQLAAQSAGGLYHLAGSERLSRAQIGELAAARHRDLNPRIEVCSLSDYRGAPRPADCSLNCGKIEPLLNFSLPGLTEYLRGHPAEPF